ncbi:glycosyltransferase [Nitratireductor soli]|uniref:glycosyltransferase n=1 Tax=Nitratireductor soli TaxID=1670619 RepID=UPI00065E3E4E|nr:glycosyltransferase [Nitratireductor soli]
MKIWIVRDLEPLRTDPGKPRLLRAGMLSMTLAARGHQTTWFTSTFNHYSRQHRVAGRQKLDKNLTVEVLAALGYSHNISLRRLLHNHLFARAFLRKAAVQKDLPDVIVADLPTTDAASAAVAFGKRNGIPTVLSIRDLWPDFFANFAPLPLRAAVRIGVWPLDRQARFACANADSLIGISKVYLNWGQQKGRRSQTDLDRIFPLGFRRQDEAPGHEIEAAMRRLGVPVGKHIVAFVGSWGATYDLALIRDVACLLAKRDDIVFVLAGNASECPELERDFRALPNVILPGWLGPDEVAALLSNAQVGLLPYAEHAPQGLPNKVFEYMAYGVYQLATLAGELKALYAETAAGRSIAGATPETLAEAVETVLADQDIAMARRQRMATFAADFDARKIYAEMADHIVHVARTPRRSG